MNPDKEEFYDPEVGYVRSRKVNRNWSGWSYLFLLIPLFLLFVLFAPTFNRDNTPRRELNEFQPGIGGGPGSPDSTPLLSPSPSHTPSPSPSPIDFQGEASSSPRSSTI